MSFGEVFVFQIYLWQRYVIISVLDEIKKTGRNALDSALMEPKI
jgi:hypothetical protein